MRAIGHATNDTIWDIAVQTVTLENLKREYESTRLGADQYAIVDERQRMLDERCCQLLNSVHGREDDRTTLEMGRERHRDERRRNIQALFKGISLFAQKTSAAVFGGLSLLAPMLIMVLHPGLLTSLVTTSVFVTAVAVLLAFAMPDAGPKDIIAATAAYTAVLVVFIGTSGGNSSDRKKGSSILSSGQIGGIVVGAVAATLVLMTSLWISWAAVWMAWSIPVLEPLPGLRILRDIYQKPRKEKV